MIEDKVFGVISYLPDKEPDRSLRIERLNRLFNNITSIFGQVNWLIIAQNWKEYDIPNFIEVADIYEYSKLGILNARKKLRHHFLESKEYNWLIMLDDDCIVEELIPNAGEEYFKTLDAHPKGFMFLRDERGEYCPSQLNMCAISRFMYQLEPMVDIDPQKGEGYEDLIFSNLLHYKYPASEFEFYGIKCAHFRNKSEKAPSTWSEGCNKHQLLATMSKKSNLIIEFFKQKNFDIFKIRKDLGLIPCNICFPIDFVFPYVDSKEETWRKQYKEYCIKINKPELLSRIDAERYEEFGWLKYLFRGLDKFMPFIRKVHLIVESENQVPEWLDKTKINIVTHKDIIPKEYLPTYNSTTIEMFLHRIPGLSEHFIYSNDDMYPLDYMTPDDFFYSNGKPKINMRMHKIESNEDQFHTVCIRSLQDTAKSFNIKLIEGVYVTPEHSFSPLRLKDCKSVFHKMESTIRDNVSSFRTSYNYNQYIYSDYAFITNNTLPSLRRFVHANLEMKEKLLEQIREDYIQILCINDNEQVDRDWWRSNKQLVEKAFLKIFPVKSKYEI